MNLIDQITVEKIFELYAEGYSLRKACLKIEVSYPRFKRLIKNDDELVKKFREDADIHEDAVIDRIGRIADNDQNDYVETKTGGVRIDANNVMRDKLRIDFLWRYLGTINARKFTDRPPAWTKNRILGEQKTTREKYEAVYQEVCKANITLEQAEKLTKIIEAGIKIDDMDKVNEEVAKIKKSLESKGVKVS